MSNEKKDRTFAALGTLLVHALMVIALLLMAFRTPLPLPGEEGVEVNLGDSQDGMGEEQPEEQEITEQTTTPPPTSDQNSESTTSEEEILTEESEDNPSIETKQEQTPKNETVTETNTDNTNKEPENTQTIDQRGLMRPKTGGSEGETGKVGDQGDPDGLKDVTRHDGNGGEGNGPGEGSGSGPLINKVIVYPSDEFQDEGFIYVEYCINREGEVYKAEIAKGTTISNVEMRNDALNKVLKWKYSPDPNRNESEKHTQPFRFILNH